MTLASVGKDLGLLSLAGAAVAALTVLWYFVLGHLGDA